MFKAMHILLIVAALGASVVCFELIDKLVFEVYVKLNNGIYPTFMPPLIETISYFIGGLIVGLVSIAILWRVKCKVAITSANLILIVLALIKLSYSVEPEFSLSMVHYEVILGGGFVLVVYFLVNKYMPSNKALNSQPSAAGTPKSDAH